jgi:regulatory protein
VSDVKTVTAIEIQKGRKNRVSVFLDEVFAFGLDQDVLVRSGIAKGDRLTPERIQQVLDLEERHRAKMKAVRLLSVRNRSRKELQDRLRQAKFAESVIDYALSEMERLKLIDDAEFARSYGQNRMVTHPVSKRMLERELKFKGLAEDEIQQGVDRAYESQDESQVARQLAGKRKKSVSHLDENKAKKRVYDFLLRRGFSWDVISDILDKWDQL